MNRYRDLKFIEKPEDIPVGLHWVILRFSTIRIPGDERSRTHPGHGYPASTTTKISYAVYPDKETWEDEIKSMTASGRTDFAPISATRPIVKTNVYVEVE